MVRSKVLGARGVLLSGAGNNFVLIDGREERVRLIGIDTPETNPADVIECFGPEATSYITALIPVGTPVRIERDVVNRDDYGRLLGYVYRAEDGVFVNYELVRSISIPARNPRGIVRVEQTLWVFSFLSGNGTAPLGNSDSGEPNDIRRVGMPDPDAGENSLPDRDLFAIRIGATHDAPGASNVSRRSITPVPSHPMM